MLYPIELRVRLERGKGSVVGGKVKETRIEEAEYRRQEIYRTSGGRLSGWIVVFCILYSITCIPPAMDPGGFCSVLCSRPQACE